MLENVEIGRKWPKWAKIVGNDENGRKWDEIIEISQKSPKWGKQKNGQFG